MGSEPVLSDQTRIRAAPRTIWDEPILSWAPCFFTTLLPIYCVRRDVILTSKHCAKYVIVIYNEWREQSCEAMLACQLYMYIFEENLLNYVKGSVNKNLLYMRCTLHETYFTIHNAGGKHNTVNVG